MRPERAPGSRVDLARIEEASLNALQTQRQLFHDGWLLRVSPGSAKRARSVNPHFGSTLPLEDKIAYCESLYARMGLPVLFRMTPFAKPAELEPALLARGYKAFDATLVQVATLDRPPGDVVDGGEDATVRVVDAKSFAHATAALRGSDATQRDAHLERLRHSPLQSRYLVVEAQGRQVATAQASGDAGIAGIFDVVTAADAQRRGYATSAVGLLMGWAWEHALETVYLQVTESNVGAVALYRKFGFATAYTYHYLGLPGALR